MRNGAGRGWLVVVGRVVLELDRVVGESVDAGVLGRGGRLVFLNILHLLHLMLTCAQQST